MNLAASFNHASESLRQSSLKDAYWGGSIVLKELKQLWQPQNAVFRQHVLRDYARYLFSSVHPVPGEAQARAQAAVAWILRAQEAGGDGGVALGYFPCARENPGWRPSYPETTGYIITSLLAYARQCGDKAVAEAAMKMVDWEIEIQMPSGAVQGGQVSPPEQQTAAAFNTGMVLDGLCSAYLFQANPRVLLAARQAADFLVNDLDESCYFKTNGAFVSPGEIKTYTCLCAWAIYRFGQIVQEERYMTAAIQVIEAALRQQKQNGWFASNCLNRSSAPLTHTIGYTLQGILEVGSLSGRADFVAQVRKTVDRIVPLISDKGYLAGRFYADWQPAAFSSCLTGSAQIAIVCYRLAQELDEPQYRLAADRLVDFLKGVQLTASDNPALQGALAGSFPLFGGYMRAGYPNWATKYLLDALMLQMQTQGRPAI